MTPQTPQRENMDNHEKGMTSNTFKRLQTTQEKAIEQWNNYYKKYEDGIDLLAIKCFLSAGFDCFCEAGLRFQKIRKYDDGSQSESSISKQEARKVILKTIYEKNKQDRRIELKDCVNPINKLLKEAEKQGADQKAKEIFDDIGKRMSIGNKMLIDKRVFDDIKQKHLKGVTK